MHLIDRYRGVAKMAGTTYQLVIPLAKHVADPEQFVPLYTCTPRNYGVVSSTSWRNPYFCNTTEYMSKFSSIIQGSLSSLLSHMTRYCTSDVRALVSGNGALLTPWKTWDRATLQLASFPLEIELRLKHLAAGLSRALSEEGFTRMSASLAHELARGLPAVSSGRQYNVTDFYYGLFDDVNSILSQRSVHRLNDGTRITKTIEDLYSSALLAPNGMCRLNWFFLASTYPKVREPKVEHYGLVALYSDVMVLNFSSVNGINTHYCAMVKAKHRLNIMRALWVGQTLFDLEIPKGDLELWEASDIESHLTKAELEVYHKDIRVPIRNGLKCPVRTFDNLTKQLFDVKENNFTTAEEIEQTKAQAIKGAKLIAKHLLGEVRTNPTISAVFSTL